MHPARGRARVLLARPALELRGAVRLILQRGAVGAVLVMAACADPAPARLGTGAQAPHADVPVVEPSPSAPDAHSTSVVSIETSPCSIAPGERSSLSATIVLPDGSPPLVEPITYAWTAPAGWDVHGEGAQVEVVALERGAEPSSHIELEVRDGSGLRMTGRALVRVAGAAPGVRVVVTATPNPVTAGGVVEVQPNLEGVPDPHELVWEVPDGWRLVPAADGHSVRLTAPDRAGEAALVRLRVRVGGEDVHRAEVPITVVGG